MMRLNGRVAIMRHLGKAASNRRAWAHILLRYGSVIRLNSATSAAKGYWAMAEDLDALDKDLAPTVHEHYGLEKLVRATSASKADALRATTYRHKMRALVAA